MLIRLTSRLILLLLFCVSLSGCRYWSLYQLGQQFCDFDSHIEVLNSDGQVGFDLIDPVLKRSIFQRYFYALPFASSESEYEHQDHFKLVSLSSDKQLSVFTNYHLGSSKPLLMGGELDPRLSQLFSASFVESVLSSVCSDDYDLSLKKLILYMSLPSIDDVGIPSKHEIIDVFGVPIAISAGNQVHYELDFLNSQNARQGKVIKLNFEFNDNNHLQKVRVIYHKYDLDLDLDNRTAKLIAIRKS